MHENHIRRQSVLRRLKNFEPASRPIDVAQPI